MFVAFSIVCSHATIIKTEPIELPTDSANELRSAALAVLPDSQIRDLEARRAEGEPRIDATVEFEPFESSAEHARLKTVRCKKIYSPWMCDPPIDVVELELPSGTEQVFVDPDWTSPGFVDTQFSATMGAGRFTIWAGNDAPLARSSSWRL